MVAGNLTTLEHVKQWLGITNDDSDVLLSRLITSASKAILNYCNRQGFQATDFSDLYNGYGQNFMVVRQWPVISVASINFSGTSITQMATGNPPNNGYLLQGIPGDSAAGGPATITLTGGYRFPNGRATVTVNYRAGYEIADEPHVVPATPFQVRTDVTWLANTSVKIGDTVLTQVASAPAAMQYSVSDEGLYTFNTAQAGATVLITYSYVPQDVEQACWELVGLRYKEKDRIGIQSKSLGGQETVSYFSGNMTASVIGLLNDYRRVAPI